MGEQTKMPGTSEQRESVDAQQGIVQVPNQTRDKDSSREMTALPSPLPPSQVLVGRTREPVAIEEDAYVSSLSAIIQRDFFPDLAKMRLQKDLDAVLLALDFRRAQELNAQLSALSAKGSATAEPAADGTDKNIGMGLSCFAMMRISSCMKQTPTFLWTPSSQDSQVKTMPHSIKL